MQLQNKVNLGGLDCRGGLNRPAKDHDGLQASALSICPSAPGQVPVANTQTNAQMQKGPS